jgi:hypothetical protein
METGVSYNKQGVRKAGYFRELLATAGVPGELLRGTEFIGNRSVKLS